LNIIDLAIDPPSKEASLSCPECIPVRYCALIGMPEAAAYITQAAFEWGLSTKLVDANTVCPGIQKVRTATRSAAATWNNYMLHFQTAASLGTRSLQPQGNSWIGNHRGIMPLLRIDNC